MLIDIVPKKKALQILQWILSRSYHLEAIRPSRDPLLKQIRLQKFCCLGFRRSISPDGRARRLIVCTNLVVKLLDTIHTMDGSPDLPSFSSHGLHFGHHILESLPEIPSPPDAFQSLPS